MNLSQVLERFSGKKALSLVAGLTTVLYLQSEGASADNCVWATAIIVAGFSLGQGVADHGRK